MSSIQSKGSATSHELTIEIDNLRFSIVCGNLTNGAYLAILNYGISAELSSLGDIDYNTENIAVALQKIGGCLLLPGFNNGLRMLARKIAEAIDPFINQTNITEQ